ncbi:hypothetical protein [Desulfatiferula olefinivorans]
MNLKSRSTGESPNSDFFTTFLFERAKQFSTFYPGVRPTANIVDRWKIFHLLTLCHGQFSIYCDIKGAKMENWPGYFPCFQIDGFW